LHNCSLDLITEFVDKTELAQLPVSVYSKSGSASREKNKKKNKERTTTWSYNTFTKLCGIVNSE